MAIDLRGRSSVSFYDTFSAFPSTGSTTTLYVDRGDMVVYIWNGSSYEQLNNGSNITTVANYSELLAIGASNVPNMFYWCSSAQGTSWLPGPLGGTYYNSGLYYSNGTTWEYMNSPYQATQIEVDAGIVADKFVTPSTLYNAVKWNEFKWTFDLMAVLTYDVYAPYNMKIISVTNVFNAPTTTILDDGAAYTLGATISMGSLIKVTVSTASVISLNVTKL